MKITLKKQHTFNIVKHNDEYLNLYNFMNIKNLSLLKWE